MKCSIQNIADSKSHIVLERIYPDHLGVGNQVESKKERLKCIYESKLNRINVRYRIEIVWILRAKCLFSFCQTMIICLLVASFGALGHFVITNTLNLYFTSYVYTVVHVELVEREAKGGKHDEKDEYEFDYILKY